MQTDSPFFLHEGKNWVGFQLKAGQTSCLFLVLANVISINLLYVVVAFFLLGKKNVGCDARK
jgi:hypothetical protein